MSLRAIAVLAGALLVSGCQTNPQGQPVTSADRMPTGAEVPGFRCPPAGTQAIYPRLTVTYHGADPADPVMCVGERSDSTMRRPVLFTLFAELENQDEIRALLSRLYPLEPGRQVSGTFIFRTPGGASLFRHNTIRILGIEDMELDGQTRRVAVVERIEQNPHFPQFHNIRYTIRLDLETGIELSREGEMLRGGPGLMSPAFRAVRLVVPQEAPVAAAARPAPSAFNCPPAGTEVRYGTGVILRYLGAQDGEPTTCLLQHSATGEQVRRRVFNEFENLGNSVEVSSLLARLYPLEPGRSTTVTLRLSTPTGTVTSHAEIRVLRFEEITIGQQSRHVAVVQRVERDWNSAQVQTTNWVDLQTGVSLAQQGAVLRGEPAIRPASWRAVEMTIGR